MRKPVGELTKLLKVLLHVVIFVLLTIVTQIGGTIYLIATFLIKKSASRKYLKRIAIFVGLYLLTAFVIVPIVAPTFGREKIEETNVIQAHSFFYQLANRNYVRPELNQVLKKIATELKQENLGIKLIYLDANFPFINRFPLLPHLSHHDGEKIDVSLVYENPKGQLTNKKPSVSGYGVYEGPTKNEYNQAAVCQQRGYWQYNFPQYLTLGKINRDIVFSEKGTRRLANLILKQEEVGRLFIEPHLKNRLNLTNKKVRFHGCQAVRHDDHIHFQLQ